MAVLFAHLFYKVDLSLFSPICVSTGDSVNTDHDVLKMAEKTAIIPGQSVCGALRNHLENVSDEAFVTYLFGARTENGNSTSRIYISDILIENARITVRDGVALDENKTTKDTGKYDYEVVEDGEIKPLTLEVKVYDIDLINKKTKHKEKTLPTLISQIDNAIGTAVASINNGDIRFGYKKTRGTGQFKVMSAQRAEFTFNDKSIVPKYFAFLADMASGEYSSFELNNIEQKNTFKISVPLELTSGISIRRYSAQTSAPDYSHLSKLVRKKTDKEKFDELAIIPGSSWNGAMRARCFEMLHDLGGDSLKNDLEAAWGKVGNNKFIASRVIFSESVLGNAIFMNNTRNKIDRFDGSTEDGALYTERTAIGGKTHLDITIKGEQNAWVAGLIELAVMDLVNGYLAVGGLTAVGRGIFKGEYKPKYQAHLINMLSEVKE